MGDAKEAEEFMVGAPRCSPQMMRGETKVMDERAVTFRHSQSFKINGQHQHYKQITQMRL